MFGADLFSAAGPTWVAVDPEYSGGVLTTLRQQYGNLGPWLDAIKVVKGNEINSNNYLVENQDHRKWILKKWSASRTHKQVSNVCRLMDYLQSLGQPVALPTALADAGFIAISDQAKWSLIDYADGHYFSGTEEELIAAGKAIGSLFKALITVPFAPEFGDGPLTLNKVDRAVLAKVVARPQICRTHLKPSVAYDLERNLVPVAKAMLSLQSIEHGRGLPQLCHFDLHPHNLLLGDNRVSSILDFESCLQLEPAVGLGFASLKLVRQAVVNIGNPARAAGLFDKFIDAIACDYPQVERLLDTMAFTTRAEVLRRIALILRLNLEQNDSAWNHVLPVQLSHLKEIPIIFRESVSSSS